ncbi:MAG: hypothetical protein ACFFDV_10035, partial [Candidatus Thorarchaeota archaeon]
MLEVKSETIKNGFTVQFKGISYPLIYPSGYWEKTPKRTREALTENLALATTMHLPLVFNDNQITYYSGRPLL